MAKQLSASDTSALRRSGGSSLVRAVPYPLRARMMRVARAEPLSATMRRIVLTGADLEPQFPFPPLGSADHVKLLLPDPATGQVTLPSIRQGQRGPEVAAEIPPVLREYTIRAVDHRTQELSIDFVLHEHGPAGRWAATASPGAPIGVLGPRGSHLYPDSCDDYLFVTDETGLPAVERFLEELPAQAPITAVVLAAADSVRELAAGRPAQIRWLTSTDPVAAIYAVAGLPISPGTFVWGAGEAGVIRALRTHLRSQRQLDAGHVQVRGYWRLGTAGAPSDEDPDD